MGGKMPASYFREWRKRTNYYQRNKDRIIANTKRHYVKNRERINQLKCLRRKNIRDNLLRLLGSECKWCKSVENLQIDHIDGGGHRDRRSFGGDRTKMFNYYLSNPEEALKKLQCLCETTGKKKEEKVNERTN